MSPTSVAAVRFVVALTLVSAACTPLPDAAPPVELKAGGGAFIDPQQERAPASIGVCLFWLWNLL